MAIATLDSVILLITAFTTLWPSAVVAQEVLPGRYKHFKTQPTFVPSAINITKMTEDKSLLAPGYYFVAPHMGARGWGPQILDQDGQLVWYGLPAVRKLGDRYMNAMDFQRCDYLGQKGNHLCFSEAQPDKSDRGYRSIGVNRVLNSQYKPEGKPYSKAGNLWFPNPHEFQMLQGGNTFVQSVYQLRKMDLRPYGGQKIGYVYDGCFQEIDVRTREEVFVWCSFDHFPVWETMVFLNIKANKVNTSTPTGGKGTKGDPWDPVHLNGLDKNEENCYLVSNRHMNQILKIAGPHNIFGKKPGEIIWRFNGKNSNFTMDDEVRIGYQHHARWVSTGANETIFTVFDNRGLGAIDNDAKGLSSFKTIKVNNVTGKAELLRVHYNPGEKMSVAQGSAQLLENKNALVGWGSIPHVSEFAPDGTLLFHAKFFAKDEGLTNYRAFKDNWVGRPTDKPKVLAYCQTCNPFGKLKNASEDQAPLKAYVSWNGATEVKQWRFSLSGRKGGGIWIPVATVDKKGFETEVTLGGGAFSKFASFAPYVWVEALDKDGMVLSSTISKTFVPQRALGDRCDLNSCFQPRRFGYSPQYSRSDECGETYTPEIIGLIILFIVIEGVSAWLDGLVRILISQTQDRMAGNGIRQPRQTSQVYNPRSRSLSRPQDLEKRDA